jgi:hypothetical protein
MENVPKSKVNENLVIVLYYVFKITPILIAGVAIYLGYRLFILGVTGQASLSVNSKEISGQLLNAAPGLFFAIGGIVTIIITVWKGVRISFDEGEMPLKSKDGDKSTHGGAGGGGGILGRSIKLMDKIRNP